MDTENKAKTVVVAAAAGEVDIYRDTLLRYCGKYFVNNNYVIIYKVKTNLN